MDIFSEQMVNRLTELICNFINQRKYIIYWFKETQYYLRENLIIGNIILCRKKSLGTECFQEKKEPNKVK